jgi:integrase
LIRRRAGRTKQQDKTVISLGEHGVHDDYSESKPFPTPEFIEGSVPPAAERKASKIALTELRIEQLPTTGKTYYANDAKQPGLAVRVSAGGVKAFVFTKFKHGRLTRITLGRVGALRLDKAQKATQALHGELALGVDVGAKRRAAKATPKLETMQEAFDRFMALKERRERTSADYEGLWRLHIPAAIKRKPVKDVTTADVEALKCAAAKRHRTANKIVTLIGSIMARSGRWADNPARGVAKHQERVRTRRLSVDELQRVWRALDSEPEWGDFFRLLILTGARRTPFCGMRWRDLDLEAGVWLVPAAWAKSKREMAIPLAGDAVRILRERRASVSDARRSLARSELTERELAKREEREHQWVWPSADSASGHAVNPEKPWRRILKAAGVKEWATLHDVRRTLGSRLAMNGVAGATISKVLGHVSPQSLKHYAHLDVTAGREAVERALFSVTKAIEVSPKTIL